jgi:hypothetical protein
LDGTPIGMTKATQALAKIAITTNPEIAFPGQRVRPSLSLPYRTHWSHLDARTGPTGY